MLIESKASLSMLAKALHQDISGQSPIKLSSVREIIAKALGCKSSNDLLSKLPVPLKSGFDVNLCELLRSEHSITTYAKPLCFLPWPLDIKFTEEEMMTIWRSSHLLQSSTTVPQKYRVANLEDDLTSIMFMVRGGSTSNDPPLTKKAIRQDGRGGWFVSDESNIASFEFRLGQKNVSRDPESVLSPGSNWDSVIALFKDMADVYEKYWSGKKVDVYSKLRRMTSNVLIDAKTGKQAYLDNWLDRPLGALLDSNLASTRNHFIRPNPLMPESFEWQQQGVSFRAVLLDDLVTGVQSDCLYNQKCLSAEGYEKRLWGPLSKLFPEAIDTVKKSFGKHSSEHFRDIVWSEEVKGEIVRQAVEWLNKQPFFNEPLRQIFHPNSDDSLVPGLESGYAAHEKYDYHSDYDNGVHLWSQRYSRDLLEGLYEQDDEPDEDDDEVQLEEYLSEHFKPTDLKELRASIEEDGEEIDDESLKEMAEEIDSEERQGWIESFRVEHLARKPINNPWELTYLTLSLPQNHYVEGLLLPNWCQMDFLDEYSFFDGISNQLVKLYRAIEENTELNKATLFVIYYVRFDEVSMAALSDSIRDAVTGYGKVNVLITSQAFRQMMPGSPFHGCRELKRVYDAAVKRFSSSLESLGLNVLVDVN
jgi:hypothetical protein